MDMRESRKSFLRLCPAEKTTFCPGCGYDIFINCFLRAVAELGKELPDFSFTAGIGCAGWIISNYFKADNFHTTHGRAIAAAVGLKAANPDLDIVTISGDGDIAGIGGNHLIHAVRRNNPIAVFCLNNFIYGMTGGQVGPTTPLGSKTASTPRGNEEPPFDLVQLVLAAKGMKAGRILVSRYPMVYPHLLIKGIKKILLGSTGSPQSADEFRFRFMEVVSPCPRQYGQKNELFSAAALLKQQKETYISKEKAKGINPEERKGKIIFGEFQNLKEYVNLLPEEE